MLYRNFFDTWLHQKWAALNKRVAAAQYILERGADVNAVDLTGQTSLHWNAVRGAIQVADLLLEEGAQVNAADIYGYQFWLLAHLAGVPNYILMITSGRMQNSVMDYEPDKTKLVPNVPVLDSGCFKFSVPIRSVFGSILGFAFFNFSIQMNDSFTFSFA